MAQLKKFRLDKMIDKTDNLTTEKKHNLFNLPMRLLLIAKTGQGKSNTLGNFLLKKEGYREDFLPENVFIFSGSVRGDEKLSVIINELDVPKENIFGSFDEEVLTIIYDMLVENFNDKREDGETDPKELNSLIIFDDLAFTDKFKARGSEDTIKKIFMNGRKFLISTIVISQKYSAVGTILRENASGIILGKSSNKQVELVEGDHNYLRQGKKAFMTMVREATEKRFSNLIINFSKPELYFDNDFDAIL